MLQLLGTLVCFQTDEMTRHFMLLMDPDGSGDEILNCRVHDTFHELVVCRTS